MDLRQLAYVVAIAEEGGFTRAAHREHVAQPGISAQVRRLEAELGLPLFHRGRTGVTLTAAGEAVLPHARTALAAAAAVRTAVDELAGVLRGHVRVGVVPSVGAWLADGLAAFHRDHPGVAVTLVEDTSDRLLRDVRAGALDLALAGVGGESPPELVAETVSDQELVAAVAHDHPLAGRRRLTVSELAEESLIALPRGTGGRAALEQGFAAAGRVAPVTLEAGDPRAIMAFARAGLGVAILPASAPEDLHVLAVTGPRMRSRLDLVWRSGAATSPAASALVAALRTAWRA